MRFADRHEAGRQLAEKLRPLALEDPVVLALPRGGVPVGFEVARALGAPLGVVLVRKLGAPGNPELAVGALVDSGVIDRVFDEEVKDMLGVTDDYLARATERESREIERRREAYLKGRPPIELEGRLVILVDDGIATGTTMRAAIQAVRRRAPAKLVLAVPVAPRDTVAALRKQVDDLVCLDAPRDFWAISPFYVDFHQLEDAEVIDYLDRAAQLPAKTAKNAP
jgi:putative phosphoribosyl transferase